MACHRRGHHGFRLILPRRGRIAGDEADARACRNFFESDERGNFHCEDGQRDWGRRQAIFDGFLPNLNQPSMLGRNRILSRWFTRSPHALLAVVYGLVLGGLSAKRPFWVDEIQQLFGTRGRSGADLLSYVSTFPGAAPLGHLLQRGVIVLLGFSPFSARVVSELSSVIGCLGIIVLVRRLRLEDRYGLALLCWMLLPLQLRYGLEARPYALALLFSILGTWQFLRLLAQPSRWNGMLYFLVLVLGAYTAPYTLFLQAGYVLWAVFFQTNRPVRILSAAALALACIAFSPWYWATANYLKSYLAVTSDVGFKITPKFLLLPIREISGGGYVCSIALILLAIVGFRSRRIPTPMRTCLTMGLIAGTVCVLATDLTFGYFFAIRQIMFILVPIILLAAAGIESLLEEKRPRVLAVLLTLFAMGAMVKNVRYFSDRSEDWSAAAVALKQATDTGACLQYAGADDPRFYTFFERSLAQHICPTSAASITLIAVPSTRYTAIKDLQEKQAGLLKAGYRAFDTFRAGGATVTVYELAR